MGTTMGGRAFDIQDKADDIASQLPGLVAHKRLSFLTYAEAQDLLLRRRI